MLDAETFRAQAKPVQVVINGQPFLADPKVFRTGSFGWYLSGKFNASIGGEVVRVQIGMNLTVIGSKVQTNGEPVAATKAPPF